MFRAGCSGCHGERDRAGRCSMVRAPVPPKTARRHGRQRYIRDSILLPKSEVVAGYEPVMPTFQGTFREP